MKSLATVPLSVRLPSHVSVGFALLAADHSSTMSALARDLVQWYVANPAYAHTVLANHKRGVPANPTGLSPAKPALAPVPAYTAPTTHTPRTEAETVVAIDALFDDEGPSPDEYDEQE